MRRFSNNIPILLLLLCLFGAISGAFSPAQAATSKTATATALVSDASNAFGFRLYQQLSQQDLNKNLFISPLSISIALAMTYNGANGQTKDEMAKTLGWQALTLPQLNTGFQSFDKLLHPAGGYATVELANELVVQQKFHLLPDFVQRCKDSFHAGLDTADFINHEPAARKKINGWVGQKTHGKINAILPTPLSPLTRLVLIDALYFKDYWQNQFYLSHTTSQPFTCADGKTKIVPMMEQSKQFAYLATDKFQAIRLPYLQDGYSMDIFLPAKSSTLSSFLKQLTPAQWQSWQRQFNMRSGTIRLPRFKADYQLDLKQPLISMGMKAPFAEFKADFSGMSKQPLFISNVFHQTTLDVSEQGTEASAVTAARNFPLSKEPAVSAPFIMTVDHPFFFAIRAKNGMILFLGSIASPRPLEVTYKSPPGYRKPGFISPPTRKDRHQRPG